MQAYCPTGHHKPKRVVTFLYEQSVGVFLDSEGWCTGRYTNGVHVDNITRDESERMARLPDTCYCAEHNELIEWRQS